jgi:GT2 family glycosyltransferase
LASGSVNDVAVLIVGYHNPIDVMECLVKLSGALSRPSFDVHICENGGVSSYRKLLDALAQNPAGPRLIAEDVGECEFDELRFTEVRRFRFPDRDTTVWVGCAADNLGYAGGLNAWIRPLLSVPGWKGVWILNPDTLPEDGALASLVERAETGGKGMVGSTIVDADTPERIRLRGGLHWQWWAARGISVGLYHRTTGADDVSEVEARLDCLSGASMYVTRSCLEKIGLMDERYFLFFEDFDWGIRAKPGGLGYASKSIVVHKRGTTTGSAKDRTTIPKLSVYLQQRNGIHFVRSHFPLSLPIRIVVSCLYALRFLLSGAPSNFVAALEGTIAGLRGEVGKPSWHTEVS